VRVVLCDDDRVLVPMVESLLTRLGHELVGEADDTATAAQLVIAAHPDAVIVDPALGYNTDFDVIEAAIEVGAATVVFTHTADEAQMSHYAVRPTVVPKPDLVELEHVIDLLAAGGEPGAGVGGGERRRRPGRAAEGPPPTGLADAQAFFEAINAAQPGDALVAVDVAAQDRAAGADVVARLLVGLVRDSDRLLASSTMIRLFLPAAEQEGVESVVRRLAKQVDVPAGTRVTSVLVAPGEEPVDAFERLRSGGDHHDLDAHRPG
jgi:hypothetical protein